MSSRSKMARSGWPKFLEHMSCSFYIILCLKNRHFWTLSGLGAHLPKMTSQNDIRNMTLRPNASKCALSLDASGRLRLPQDTARHANSGVRQPSSATPLRKGADDESAGGVRQPSSALTSTPTLVRGRTRIFQTPIF